MKSTGIVRHLDELGRIVIPKEWRRILNIENGDQLEIYVEGSRIILEKYSRSCCFCDNLQNLTEFKGQLVCQECIEALKGE